VGRRTVKRGSTRQVVNGKGFRLADEIGYIQDKAADHNGRVVPLTNLIRFCTSAGDAWLLDVANQLAARLAQDRDPQSGHLGEPIDSKTTRDLLRAAGGQEKFWAVARTNPKSYEHLVSSIAAASSIQVNLSMLSFLDQMGAPEG
jgi:hypothetical protein